MVTLIADLEPLAVEGVVGDRDHRVGGRDRGSTEYPEGGEGLAGRDPNHPPPPGRFATFMPVGTELPLAGVIRISINIRSE